MSGVMMDGLFTVPVPGTATAAANKARIQIPFPIEVLAVYASVGTAPTGAALIVDVNKDDTTIFTTQANRPTIAVSTTETAAAGHVPDVTEFPANSTLSVDVDQIGSTVAGANLTVTVQYRYDTSP